LHARKPAACAAAAVAKKPTLAGFGVRAGQLGRQYTPVEVTATMNQPSNLASRLDAAR
jgi:hypothetical protein